MTSTKAFNGMLFQFVEELAHAFPHEPKLQACVTKLPLLTDANPKKAMGMFLEAFTPFAHKISAQDDTLFDDVPSLCGFLDVRGLWVQADAPTRAVIWQYLQTLLFMASTVSALPPELLSSIESVAESCASKMDAGELDISQFLSSLPNVINQIASSQRRL
ncbi:hypothetical protein COO60DRAFT_1643819 [Scenedesmus sp. NREL 46B-D3]|nr:hypothetical protein COO60DRAFT_1643819 [Scenedesmus sp. NREL 46B-D3]